MKSLLAKIGLLFGTALFSIFICEIGLRLVAPIPYSMEVQYVPDGHLGTRLVPNQTYSLKDGGFCTIESHGFRRLDDVAIQKPPGVVRIVALGGSSTFAYRVADEFTWPATLERQLREHYGPHVEVINAGVPGYSVFESKVNYMYRIRALDPDIIIVYHTWNDVKRFQSIEAGKLMRKGASDHSSWIKSLLRHSQIAWRIKIYYYTKIVPRRAEDLYGSPADNTVNIKNGGRAHRWERQHFEDIASLARGDGVIPILASQACLLSRGNLENPEVRAKVGVEMQRMSYEELLDQWEAISALIQETAESSNGIFVDVYGAVDHDLDHFFDHVHLTKRGNTAVADSFFETITTSPETDALLRRN